MRVYLDHNATSPLRPEARALLLAELDALGGNPSSLHAGGRRARAVVDEARERAAAALGVRDEAVLFTSGGTEANNAAVFGTVRAAGAAAGLVTSAIEHPSVLETAAALEREGRPVARIGVDARARLDEPALLHAAAAPWARVVSLMAANNEVGVRFPLEGMGERLARAAGERRVLHVDAVQALGRIPLEIERWGADLVTLSAHKVGGPLGVGLLVRDPHIPLGPWLFGGGQELGLRGGTENAPAIAAAALAVELAVNEQEAHAARTKHLASELWRALSEAVSGVHLVGPPLDAPDRLPNTLDLRFEGIDGRVFLARLDLEGLAASSGSACASGSSEPSHVLLAMGMSPEDARACVRLSLGRTTDLRDVRQAVDILRTTSDVVRATRC